MILHAPLIIDVAGFRLTAAEKARLAHPLVGGVILFGRNWESREQLTTLCRQIKAVRRDLLIAVDHEGGRVQRFRTGGFTHLPPMAVFGELWGSAPKKGEGEGGPALRATNAAAAAGYVLGAELRACGVDLSFTPVLDLDYGESSVIGDRAFGRDPRMVTVLAQALMAGLRRAGMGNCGKHFPGHGFVRADSHIAIPVDRRSLRAILAEDAAPYGWLSASLDAVMPAHVIYPRVDSRPADTGSSTTAAQHWHRHLHRRAAHRARRIPRCELPRTGHSPGRSTATLVTRRDRSRCTARSRSPRSCRHSAARTHEALTQLRPSHPWSPAGPRAARGAPAPRRAIRRRDCLQDESRAGGKAMRRAHPGP